MNVYGELVRAQLEILTSDPSAGLAGRIWFNSSSNDIAFEDGTNIGRLYHTRSTLTPAATATYDLGATGTRFRHLYLSGNADISGNIVLGGTITLGDTSSDLVTINSRFAGSIIPDSDNVYDLGSSTKRYANIYVGALVNIADGTAAAPSLVFLSDVDCGLFRNSANDWGLVANGSQKIRITASTVSILDDFVLGATSSDTIGFTGRVNTDILPSTANARALGSSANYWTDIFGTAHAFIGSTSGVTRVKGHSSSADYTIALPAFATATVGYTPKISAINTATSVVTLDWATDVGATRAALQVGAIENLGLSLSSGTISLVQAGGSALSGSNPGYVTIPSTTSGQLKTFAISAAKTFRDAASTASDIAMTFGSTTGIAWAQDRPFYIYAINSDDTDTGIDLAISLNPCFTVTPGTNDMAYKGNAPTNSAQDTMFVWTSTNIKATHNAKPCARIGGFRMQKSTANDWTIQTLSTSSGDGLRRDPFVGKAFTFPVGQNGANASTYFSSGAGTPPSWATMASVLAKYTMTLDGFFEYHFTTRDAGNCTNGSGGNALRLYLPYVASSALLTSGSQLGICGVYEVAAASALMTYVINGTSSNVLLRKADGATQINDNSFSSAGDDLDATFRLKAFS